MRLHIFLGILCFTLLAGSCNSVPISRNQLAEILVEMSVTDQKIQGQPELRRLADTTLVYASVLHKYGYTVEDFNRSLNHHLQKPEKLKKVLIPYRDQIITEKAALQKQSEAPADSTQSEEPLHHFMHSRPFFFPFSLKPVADSILPQSMYNHDFWSIDILKTITVPWSPGSGVDSLPAPSINKRPSLFAEPDTLASPEPERPQRLIHEKDRRPLPASPEESLPD